ncbi:hypothetical protein FBR05_02200 [Deltaproteobacteria bacterium PRO3]|nr:hypothetical protein [Deltaproteobacteria bacterium PRO3]
MTSIFRDGIPIDNPKLLLNLEMSQTDFCTQLGLVKGPPGLIFEHLFNCKFLSGIESSCRVHFVEGKLKKVTLTSDQAGFYHEVHKKLSAALGKPKRVSEGRHPDWPELTWDLETMIAELGPWEYWGCMLYSLSFERK